VDPVPDLLLFFHCSAREWNQGPPDLLPGTLATRPRDDFSPPFLIEFRWLDTQQFNYAVSPDSFHAVNGTRVSSIAVGVVEVKLLSLCFKPHNE
jgi:hypothetical protein